MDEITNERLEELKQETWGFRDSSEPTLEAWLSAKLLEERHKTTYLEQALDTRQAVYDKLLADYMAMKTMHFDCPHCGERLKRIFPGMEE